MGVSFKALQGKLSLKDFFALGRYNKSFAMLHPDYFYPDGILLFTGPQGSGKTLSAVKYVSNLVKMYPKVKVISNMELKFVDTLPYIGFTQSLEKYPSNGEFGLIMLIDEIQTEFSSLDSKNMSPSQIAAISQQRKRRVHIVGTAQLWTRIAKPFREQTSAAVDCDSILGGRVQRNRVIDFQRCAYDMNGNLTEIAYSKQFWWTRSTEDYEAYDTSNVIKRFNELEKEASRK